MPGANGVDRDAVRAELVGDGLGPADHARADGVGEDQVGDGLGNLPRGDVHHAARARSRAGGSCASRESRMVACSESSDGVEPGVVGRPTRTRRAGGLPALSTTMSSLPRWPAVRLDGLAAQAPSRSRTSLARTASAPGSALGHGVGRDFPRIPRQHEGHRGAFGGERPRDRQAPFLTKAPPTIAAVPFMPMTSSAAGYTMALVHDRPIHASHVMPRFSGPRTFMRLPARADYARGRRCGGDRIPTNATPCSLPFGRALFGPQGFRSASDSAASLQPQPPRRCARSLHRAWMTAIRPPCPATTSRPSSGSRSFSLRCMRPA